VLAVAEAKHLDVVDCDRAAGGRDVPRWGVQDALVGAGEDALFNGDAVDEVNVVDLDVSVGEGGEPAAEEFGTSCLPLAAHPTGRLEDDVVR